MEYKNVVLHAAIWNLTDSDLKTLRVETEVDADQAVLTLMKKLSLPETVVAIEDADVHRFLLGTQLGRQAFAKFAKNRIKLSVEEVLPTDGPRGSEGRYAHDVMIPYVRNKRAPSETFINASRKANAREVFVPGSEWSFVSLYLNGRYASDFITTELSAFTQTLPTSKKWFYIQYFDPFYHIRLRVHDAQLAKVLKWSQSLVAKGACESFKIETYRRETERYGGIEGCEIFESLSALDSRAALMAHSVFHEASLPREQLVACAAVISTLGFFRTFKLTTDELDGSFNKNQGDHKINESPLSQTLRDLFAGHYDGSATNAFKQIENAYADRDRSMKSLITRFKETIRSTEITGEASRLSVVSDAYVDESDKCRIPSMARTVSFFDGEGTLGL